MADELSNKTVILALVLAIAVSLGGTFLVLNKMAGLLNQGQYQMTGFATSSDGTAQIHIEDQLSIQMVTGNTSIDFGTCFAPEAPDTASISSEMTPAQVNATAINCSSSNLPAGFVIENVGNLDANVTIASSETAEGLLGSSLAELYYRSIGEPGDSGCAADKDQDSYNEIAAAATKYKICDNLTKGGSDNKVRVYINVTIPYDADTDDAASATTLTFTGHTI